MDALLGQLTSQAMNYAIRSGITITTTYALKQCSRLVRETSHNNGYRDELLQLQQRLDGKIRILSPSIDMIELISARGNTTLESAVSITKDIRIDIQKLGVKVADAAEVEERLRKVSGGKISNESELTDIIRSIKGLLSKIEDAIPLINLAITTSGVNLSTKLSGTISPSRLLQASTFLTAADTKYVLSRGSRQQVGPTWTLSLYMLFAGHANRAVNGGKAVETTWKEVIHKARVKLLRVPVLGVYEIGRESRTEEGSRRSYLIPGEAQTNEYAYQLVVIEDLDDDRIHTFEEGDRIIPFDEVANAGIRDVVPIHEVSKIFYADTGKILNIGSDDETNNPVLLIKRDVYAEAPRKMLKRSPSPMSRHGYNDSQDWLDPSADDEINGVDEQSEIDAQIHRETTPVMTQRARSRSRNSSAFWRLPMDLDPEWMAFEVYAEEPDSASDLEESEAPSRPTSSGHEDALSRDITRMISDMKLKTPSPQAQHTRTPSAPSGLQFSPALAPPTTKIKTSLSLLEMLIKLTALQQFRQDSHLAIEDELLNFFLEDSATAGAGPDKEFRQRLRHDAVKRVGFDPYDESPVKRRGEGYIANQRGKASPRPEFDANAFRGRLPNSFVDENVKPLGQSDSVRPSIEYSPFSPLASPPSPQTPSKEKGAAAPDPVAPRGQLRSGSRTGPNFHRPGSHDSMLLIPPGTVQSRRAIIRAQSEPKLGSPLAKEVGNEEVRDADLDDLARML